ncbi:MAG: polysaccharide biosynthesis/export family protein [Ferruginibacter sp.]
MFNSFRNAVMVCLTVLCCYSCSSSKNYAYLKDVSNNTYNVPTTVTEAPFQVNDILGIQISSLDAEASAAFNSNSLSVNKSSTVTGSQAEAGGYLIDAGGLIYLPVLGAIKAEGYTKTQLKNNITNLILAKKLLLQPTVEIRHLNYEVTVIGEVAKPTVITVPSEKISLVKALGLAGDMTIYGKRNNILLIREEAGKRLTQRIDINSADFISSPFYYLQPNDVVYVEPNKAKIASSSRMQQVLPFVIAGLSASIIVLDRVLR